MADPKEASRRLKWSGSTPPMADGDLTDVQAIVKGQDGCWYNEVTGEKVPDQPLTLHDLLVRRFGDHPEEELWRLQEEAYQKRVADGTDAFSRQKAEHAARRKRRKK